MQDSQFYQNRAPLNSILDTVQDFGIIVGEHHTYDKVAASLALFLSLNTSGKNAQIISKTEPKVEVSNLVGINKIKKGFDGTVNQLVFELPYREGEIEKISYNGDGNKLYINVIGGQNGINFTDQDIHIVKKGSSPSVIFAVGVKSMDEISSFVDPSTQVQVINIDTDSTNAMYGDILYVDPSSSSISEITGKIIVDSGLMIDQDIAQNVMNGIVSGTSNFSSPQTSPVAFEVAAFMMRSGAQRQKIKLNEKREPIRPEFQPKPQHNQQRHNNPQHNQPRQQQQQHGQFSGQNQSHAQSQVEPKPQFEPQPEQPMDSMTNGQDTGADIPSDWFTPKVFRGSKGPQE